ncbi:MAG: hybrid sensor histidine kinase/response regulator [Carboxylicivirga sp.]|jgi:DNA-binding response OmpR family regulator|nr:hybrid sensor histidine kinase/response regulator [Carboxylicivirga sp.]
MKLTYNPADYKILIVDDAPKNLQVLGKSLKDIGYQVQFATSGLIALDWLKSHTFDLVLLDVMMPEMDGFEVCRILRADPKYDDMPIIYLTANTDLEHTINGLESGAQDYVTKPFRAQELLARIQTQIELRQSKLHVIRTNSILEEKVRQRTEQLIKAQEQLLNLEQAKGDFLRIISHEIRTPLNVILGFTGILKNNIETEAFIDYLNMLEEAAKRLEDFSLNALLITSLQLGNYKMNRQELNANSLVLNLLENYRNHEQNQQIKVSNRLDQSVVINGDAKLIDKSIQLIIDNALKVSPEDSIVQIDTYEVDNSFIVNVSDSGPGFSKDALTNLFSLFANPDKHVDKNIGIGLALVKLIMDAHNAEVTIANNSKGASVMLKFDIEVKN